MTGLIPSPQISLVEGRPAVTSLDVSQHFGKRHDSVIRDIRRIMSEMPEDLRHHNFVATFRTVAGPNNSQRQEEYFIIYQDGFMLLVMGYTGAKAMQIKIAYIIRFNEMAEELKRRMQQPQPALPEADAHTPSTPDDRAPLRALVHAWAQASGQPHTALWPQVKAHFQLSRIDDLPVEWIPDALTWVQGKIDALALPQQPAQKALPGRERSNVALYGTPDFYRTELDKLQNTLMDWDSEVYHRLTSFERELSRLTGPLFNMVLDALPAARGKFKDDGLAALHFARHSGANKIRDGFGELLAGVQQARYFARTLRG